jgi:hypothetical protein
MALRYSITCQEVFNAFGSWRYDFSVMCKRSQKTFWALVKLRKLMVNIRILRVARLKCHDPLRVRLPQWAFATGGLQSPPLRVGSAFLLQLGGRSWIPSLRGFPPPPRALPAAPLRLYPIEPLLLRCYPSYMGLNAVATQGAKVELFFIA